MIRLINKLKEVCIEKQSMNNTPIYVVMRMTPDSRTVLSGNGSRPDWFSKQKVFESVFSARDEHTRFLILFDGDSSQHWIKNYPVQVVPIQGGDGDRSFMIQMQVIREMKLQESDIIYVLEDDYVHRPGWTTVLREGLSSLLPSTLKFDYVTLYDHYDKYNLTDEFLVKNYTGLQSQIGLSKSVHWRTIPSTTNTFAMQYKTFLEDYEVHQVFKNSDHNKFTFLQRGGRKVASCVPGYSTHCHKDYLSPCIDWEQICK